MEKVLVINAGSSSIKFQLYNLNDLTVVAKGICERIKVDGIFKISYSPQKVISFHQAFPTVDIALNFLLKYLLENKIISNKEEIVAIGHRIVHGGTKITQSCVVDEKVVEIIDSYSSLAPLHIPSELAALRVLQKIFSKAIHVAVLDTTFHTTIPYQNYMYGVKQEWLEKYEVRRFGFHGISYQYVCEKMQTILNKPKLNLIVCHLGSGSSICAIADSKSVSTSMGFSAIDGLIMCTRTGDISPMVVDYMSKQLNVSHEDILDILMKESGLKGLTNYVDMRDIEQHLKEAEVKKGFDVFIKRIVNFISTSLNDIQNRVDAIVFCGGIGENSSLVREKIINNLYLLKAKIDPQLNNIMNKDLDYLQVSAKDSDTLIYVVNTNEEMMIAKETKRLLK